MCVDTLAIRVSLLYLFSLLIRPPPSSTLFPYTTLFRSGTSDGGRGTSEPPVSGSEREISRSEAQIWDVKPQFSDFLAAASPSEVLRCLFTGQDSSSEGAVSGSEAGIWE